MKDKENVERIPKRIVIKTPNWLGDSVMSIPAVRGVKRIFPGAQISILTCKWLGELWHLIPEVDKVYTSIDGKKFDLGITLINSFRSALRMWLSGVPNRMGYSLNWRGFLLTHPVKLPLGWEKMHEAEYFLKIIRGLTDEELDPMPSIEVSADLVQRANIEFLKYEWDGVSPLIGVHATASYGSAKQWMPERFSRLMDKLIEYYKAYVVLVGSPNEKAIAENIVTAVSKKNKVINVVGKTGIMNLAGIIKACRLFIANDSGPMHLAGALGTPVVAIFGSTDPYLTGPCGKVEILRKEIMCSPCFRRECNLDMECMRMIEVNDVLLAVKKLMVTEKG